MASSYNFSVTQGSELSTRLTITNDDSPVNLSGFNVRGVVKHKYGDTGSLVDLNPTIVTGTTGSLYASGFVDIYLSGSQTAALPVAEAKYDIERYVTGSEGQETAVVKMLNGKFTINPEVTT
jgi:hypothetical protein|tara:strand:+ start:2088 stop:2453 length:366 start_codon:yes stop_codon:yes gene_type:complete